MWMWMWCLWRSRYLSTWEPRSLGVMDGYRYCVVLIYVCMYVGIVLSLISIARKKRERDGW